MEFVTTLAIDPGSSSGAIAVYNPEHDTPVRAYNMPTTLKDIYRLLESFATPKPYVYIEDVGGTRPGNSAKSARTFAEHCGALKMALVALEFSHQMVLPRKWLTGLFGESYPKGSTSGEVKLRKHFVYERMQRVWPAASFTLRQADAVAILRWAISAMEL